MSSSRIDVRETPTNVASEKVTPDLSYLPLKDRTLVSASIEIVRGPALSSEGVVWVAARSPIQRLQRNKCLAPNVQCTRSNMC
jgi:hypothetical protein